MVFFRSSALTFFLPPFFYEILCTFCFRVSLEGSTVVHWPKIFPPTGASPDSKVYSVEVTHRQARTPA
jgi:hypothetical protein